MAISKSLALFCAAASAAALVSAAPTLLSINLGLPTGYDGELTIDKAPFEAYAAQVGIELPAALWALIPSPVTVSVGTGYCAEGSPDWCEIPAESGISGSLCTPGGVFDISALTINIA